MTDPLPVGTLFLAETDPGSPWTVTTPAVGTNGTVTFTDTAPFAAGLGHVYDSGSSRSECTRRHHPHEHGHCHLHRFQLAIRLGVVRRGGPDRHPQWEQSQ